MKGTVVVQVSMEEYKALQKLEISIQQRELEIQKNLDKVRYFKHVIMIGRPAYEENEGWYTNDEVLADVAEKLNSMMSIEKELKRVRRMTVQEFRKWRKGI